MVGASGLRIGLAGRDGDSPGEEPVEPLGGRSPAGDQALLAGLDEALERGTDCAVLVRAYVESDVGKEVRWLLEGVPVREQGKLLAREAPY